MAKAVLDILLDKLSGRLTGDSRFYTSHRHGKTIISNYPMHRDPQTTTENQRANSNAFGQAVKQCKAEMNDPERLAYWTARYKAYKKAANKNLAKANAEFFGVTNGVPNVPKDKYYETLRGFIIGQLRVQQKKEGDKREEKFKKGTGQGADDVRSIEKRIKPRNQESERGLKKGTGYGVRIGGVCCRFC